MRIVSKPIKTMVVFEYEKDVPVPYKFKMREDSGEEITVVVDQRIGYCRSKIAGIDCIIYQCQSTIGGIETRYELKYIINKCQWQLYKI